jgi:hypothetical protein
LTFSVLSVAPQPFFSTHSSIPPPNHSSLYSSFCLPLLTETHKSNVLQLLGACHDLRRNLLSASLFVHVNTNMKEQPSGQHCWPFLWRDSMGCKIFAQPMPDTLFTCRKLL